MTDATLASLAAFGVSLAAVRLFSASELGVYAVFFAGFMLGTMVAYQLIYVPAEVIAVGQPFEARLWIVGRSVLLGLVPSLVETTAVLLAALATSEIASADLLVGLTATSWIAVLVSPTQDHVRRLLHLAGWSWEAAIVSAVQLGTAIASIALMIWLDVPTAWVPFGALAAANAVSLTTAFLFARFRRGPVRLSVTFDSGELLTCRSKRS